MPGETILDRIRDNATGVVSTLVTGVWLAALFTGQDWWLAALLLGYVAVVPLTAILLGDETDRARWWDDESTGDAADETADAETPLERLRRRYAEGELTDEQFERKVERLLETETLEDVEDDAPDRTRETERT
ncbi:MULTISPECIES: SHOCT domain-containing protein [Haloarcula]|uniref:SHOCT domain-containing protein n=1 Tax=Haloarcula TaxID=2237 RepID=UPI0023ECB746|nr:SHOCT domain-containing protein [Halomicroarcula sp. XH51]